MEAGSNQQPQAYTSVSGNLETTFDDDVELFKYERLKADRKLRNRWIAFAIVCTISVIALAWSIVATAVAINLKHKVHSQAAQARSQNTSPVLPVKSRIAFGSCTAKDLRPQPIWTQGVIPSEPDAWIWLGDFAYVDLPPWDADSLCDEFPDSVYCDCERDWLHQGKGSCLAGDPDHVRQRFHQQLLLPEYLAFLDYMCPDYQKHSSASGNNFPPAGGDPLVCPRTILGIYDDHDFGRNNADGRLPLKHQLKQLFLDALGEDQGSPRRSAMSGIEQHVRLNEGHPGKEVDVVLLDGRYYRDPLPCEMRSKWCEGVLETEKKRHGSYQYCEEFLRGGQLGRGACCRSDGELGAWCRQARSMKHPLYRVACDPTSQEYGSVKVALSEDDSALGTDHVELWDKQAGAQLSRLSKDSPICDVLGMQQRAWLGRILRESRSPLKIVASGSVLMGSVNYTGDSGTCSGDDWLCYPNAQVNLLHTLANTSYGCVIVLTGDFHFSDIKVAQPGKHAYSTSLMSQKLQQNVFQVMASGMSDSTAQHNGAACEGTFREDLVGLRPLGKCSYMAKPSFGMLDIDWNKQLVHLQIRDGANGDIARGHDGTRQEVVVSLKTCRVVQ